jgi:hypothetical protein
MIRPAARSSRLVRLARIVVLAAVVAIGINAVVWSLVDWHLADMHVYQDAALRIRAGDQLYGGEVNPLDAYRYAPWFAYAWIPLTYLPQLWIDVVWSAFLLAGSALAIWIVGRPLTRSTLILLLLMAPILLGISAIGNVHGPMMALLLLGMPRRWGGMAVGIAASLKVVPIILVLVFVAQRRWTQVAATLATAAVLWLPILGMDVAMVTLDPGAARSLPDVLWLPVAGLTAGAAAVLAWRRSPDTALAASTAAVLALPRLFVYEISLLLVALTEVSQSNANGAAGDAVRDLPTKTDAQPLRP